jgi:hypothetical protein
MVQWMKDRDLLVAETLDLLKNAAGKSKQAISAERIESPTTEPSRAAIALPTFDRFEVKGNREAEAVQALQFHGMSFSICEKGQPLAMR